MARPRTVIRVNSLEPSEVLKKVVTAKEGGELRQGQVLMTQEVARALKENSHLLVEAGTGTGKSLAYLLPSILHTLENPQEEDDDSPQKRVVVSTATKALQEQLFKKDLPFLRETLKYQDVEFKFSILKGRSNYACRAKLDALKSTPSLFLELDQDELNRAAEWVETTSTGDREEINLSQKLWSEISVEPGECPGASECPFGEVCFAEAARSKAQKSDVIVVNTALYSAHLASGGAVLPPHQAVIFDEAHTLEDIAAEAFGVTLSAARIGRAASLLKTATKSKLADRLRNAATAFELELEGFDEKPILAYQPPFSLSIQRLRDLSMEADRELRSGSPSPSEETAFKQALLSFTSLLEVLSQLLNEEKYKDSVVYSQKQGNRPVLKMTPVDIAPILADALFSKTTVVATSATLAVGGEFSDPARRFGLTLPASSTLFDAQKDALGERPAWRSGIVPSPFDYNKQGFLYLPEMPHPRSETFMEKLTEQLDLMAQAANGRTLALFTSRKAMNEASEILRAKGNHLVLVQDEMPRTELLDEFTRRPGSIICATQGFWTGIDIPGDALSHVSIDKIPFPRPTDPLQVARRKLVAERRGNPFAQIDIPVAATLLAQGVGRLIRTQKDRGVVTIFDPRFSDSSYAHLLKSTLPPLKEVKDIKRVIHALEWINNNPRLV